MALKLIIVLQLSSLILGKPTSLLYNMIPYQLFTTTGHQIPIQNQYHSQDDQGQYSYGYSSDFSSKKEIKTSDGITRGGYSYVDSNGIIQNVQYTADAQNGFQVYASNLPKAPTDLPQPVTDTPEVERARAEHLKTFEEVKRTNEILARAPPDVPTAHGYSVSTPIKGLAPARSYVVPVNFSPFVYHPIASGIIYNSLVPHSSSQYHSQDDRGQYSFGYSNPMSSKVEVKTLDGVIKGGYSYVDANGIFQTVNYIADDVNGFRIAASNIPVAPTQEQGPTETPEVVAAKIAHEAAYQEALKRVSNLNES